MTFLKKSGIIQPVHVGRLRVSKLIEFGKIIVILDERISDEDRKKLLEDPPPDYDGQKPKVTMSHSDLFPSAMMYLVDIGVEHGRKWLHTYQERGLTAFPFPEIKILASVRYKTRIRFKG